ncbi:MAG: hypothetical protein R2686_07015 [Candidatus Nanopelagicales bacterium]
MDTGTFAFDVRCPDCKRVVEIEGTVETVLTRREQRGDKLSLALIAKPVDHDCRVEQLTVDTGTGEVLP